MSIVRHPSPPLELLRELRLFRGCSDKELRRIDSLVCRQDVDAGTELCRQGSVGRQAFIIVAGEAQVTINDAAIATLGPGSFFGEMSVLDNCDRVASVRALTPMIVLVLSSSELEQLITELPRVARRMLATMGTRLRLADRRLVTNR